LCQTFFRAKEPPRRPAVQRGEDPVDEAAGRLPRELAVLGRDLRREHAVDLLVVTSAAGEQRRVGEVVVGNDGEQCLRQVVVDVRVDAEEDVLQRMQ
jgi:hypothetical protein